MKQKKDVTQNIDSNIKAGTVLFFDLDGTLVDTNLANFFSYKKAILSVTKSDYNLPYSSDIRFNRNNLKSTIPNLSKNEYERIIQEKEKYYKGFLPETRLMKPLADVLLKYSKTNETVLVTNCRQDRAFETLDYHSITDKFSKLFFRQLSVKGEIINKFKNAISKLGVSPKLVIAFENEEIEIANAKQAGIPIINPIIA
jgi:beta-phosphoglucomutase